MTYVISLTEYAVDKTLKGIQDFNEKALKSVETVEKNYKPTKEGNELMIHDLFNSG